MIRLLTVTLTVLIGFGMHASKSDAQAAAERASDTEARALFEAGREAFDAAEFERALDHFQRAYDLSGRAELLYNIGQSADRARKDEVALAAYERFLEAVPESPYRARVETRAQFLRAHSAEDAEDTGSPEASDAPAGSDLVTETEAHSVESSAGPSRVGPWLLVGGGAAVAATGSVLLALGQSARRDVEDPPLGAVWTDVSDAYNSAAPLGTAGVAALAVGVAASGAGVIWLVVSGDDERVAVVAGLQGLIVQGSF